MIVTLILLLLSSVDINSNMNIISNMDGHIDSRNSNVNTNSNDRVNIDGNNTSTIMM